MNKPKILISIRPKWCEKIFNGEKMIEVRKTAPKIDTPFEALVYETKGATDTPWVDEDGHFVYKGRGQVIGSFVCDKVDEYSFSNLEARYRINDVDLVKTCLNHPELIAYGKGKTLRGLHITEPKLFDRPRELLEFGTVCDKLDNDKCDNCPYLRDDDAVFTWCGVDNIKPITRAPQSWIYVEEIDNG